MKRVKITDFKTKRINQFTGGKIDSYQMPDYPGNDGKMTDCFVTIDGKTYLGSYSDAWWYFTKNMVVCNDYPHGVAILLKSYKPKITLKNSIKDKFESWFTEQWENDNLIGYYGYTHRGGQTFKIGDRLFDESYTPKESDYTKDEWIGFVDAHNDCIKRELKDGYYDNEDDAKRNIPVSDVIPFKMRGTKLIENWNEAKQAAINMSEYLS